MTLNPVPSDPGRVPGGVTAVENGTWWWVKDGKAEHLLCVTEVGTNYATVCNVWGQDERIHFNDWNARCRPEPDFRRVIAGFIEEYRGRAQGHMLEIQSLMSRLGVVPEEQVSPKAQENAMIALSGTKDLAGYRKDLAAAKDEKLPELFSALESDHKALAAWMGAEALHLKGTLQNVKGVVEKVEDRIFSLNLYAGLTEEVVLVRKGEAAQAHEKLHVMQRLCYMDEECLAGYELGGIEFRDIKQFDQWLSAPCNFTRLLPFERTITAFQVRRHRKHREATDLQTALINILLEGYDAYTFLYIRNGQSIHRLSCDLEFGTFLFPGRDELRLDEPMMAKVFAGQVEDVITKRHYEDELAELKAKEKARKKASAKWARETGKKESDIHNPHWSCWDHPEDFQRKFSPFDPSSVYYDDISREIESRVRQYNRIALIIQGLFDRSTVLHPHPEVKVWDPQSFQRNVELIYADHNLYMGEAPPDFEAYRASLEAGIKEGVHVIGQRAFWVERETERYNATRRYDQHVHSYTPYGNPGPSFIQKVDAVDRRKRMALFRWTRERRRPDWYKNQSYNDRIPVKMWVPLSRLLNVDGYQRGDYRKFYEDPRSRERYLAWAHTLLSCEEWHAGNRKVADEE